MLPVDRSLGPVPATASPGACDDPRRTGSRRVDPPSGAIPPPLAGLRRESSMPRAEASARGSAKLFSHTSGSGVSSPAEPVPSPRSQGFSTRSCTALCTGTRTGRPVGPRHSPSRMRASTWSRVSRAPSSRSSSNRSSPRLARSSMTTRACSGTSPGCRRAPRTRSASSWRRRGRRRAPSGRGRLGTRQLRTVHAAISRRPCAQQIRSARWVSDGPPRGRRGARRRS